MSAQWFRIDSRREGSWLRRLLAETKDRVGRLKRTVARSIHDNPLHVLIDSVWSVTLAPRDLPVALGPTRLGSIGVAVDPYLVWKELQLRQKLASVVGLKWTPDAKKLMSLAKETFIEQTFGTNDDGGELLFHLSLWHARRTSSLGHLLETDKEKARALEAFCVGVRTRFRFSFVDTSHMRLGLQRRVPILSTLVTPMIIKVPVRSLQYALELDVAFAFNSIRAAVPELADDLIAVLYDLLYLQQKSAIALLMLEQNIAKTMSEKSDHVVIAEEVDGIVQVDAIVPYLKATIEKAMLLVALVLGVKNLESRKTTSARLSLLREVMAKTSHGQVYYAEFFLERCKSEHLERINNLRGALLHKRGLSKLQPHSYVGQKPERHPLVEIADALHERHAENSAMLLVALAMLTDLLVGEEPMPGEVALMEELYGEMRKVFSAETIYGWGADVQS